MGRTTSSASASASERVSHQLRLELKAPSFFRCPISLEVMRSPVSLCTGVTYDRSSIQRWLDSGNTTCPATMLPLPSIDLVPNLTLRRLINVWSSSAARATDDSAPAELVNHIRSTDDPFTHVQKLAAFFANPDVDATVKNGAINAGEFVNVAVGVVVNKYGGGQLMAVEAGIDVVSLVLCSEWVEEGNKERLISALCADFDATLISLIEVLKDGSKYESRKNSARILKQVLSASESKICMPEKFDALIPELIRLVSSSSAIDEGLGCLIELLPSRKAMKTMVQAKLVRPLIRIVSPESLTVSSGTAEKAVIILEAAAYCAAGRAAISEMVEECVQGVMGRMLKFGKGGKEAAVGLLWCVCYSSGGDRRAKEAVAAVSGGTAKILVVMQGDCSPAVRRMAGDLLRVLRANANSFLAGYDTKTTHIMPF